MDSAKAFAREYDIPRFYDSYEALVNDSDVEAVYVATPNSLHYENCRLCLEHGKHVLCEKPFTINEKQAKELYRLAKDKHLLLWRDYGYGFCHCIIVCVISFFREQLEKLNIFPVSMDLLQRVPEKSVNLTLHLVEVLCWI